VAAEVVERSQSMSLVWLHLSGDLRQQQVLRPTLLTAVTPTHLRQPPHEAAEAVTPEQRGWPLRLAAVLAVVLEE